LTRTPDKPGRSAVRHVAFLRAINVGKRVVRMEDLRKIFEARGFLNVQTFIQTGNVIFEPPPRVRKSPGDLERDIEALLAKALGYEVVTFLRSPGEIAALAGVVTAHSTELAAGASLYIGFLRARPPKAAVARLAAFSSDDDDFQVHGRELHWLRRRTGLADYAGPAIEKVLGVPMTVRNITTVVKLAAKHCGEASGRP
jgi:uncharacterized protein (DUF1697 family)